MKKFITLSVLAVLVLTGCDLKKSDSVKNIIGIDEAKAKAENFINNNLAPGSTVKEVSEVHDFGNISEVGLYKVVVNVGGQEYDSYISKDGKDFLPNILNISKVEAEKQAAPAAAETAAEVAPAVEYSADDKTKIDEFVACLAEKKFKIYGANWCSWTKKLTVDTFGGFDVVKPIYVECTEEADLCEKEGVTGYPTLKLDDQAYSGERTFEAIAAGSGCEAPAVQVVAAAITEDASCGN